MEYFDILTEDGDKTGMQESRSEVHRDGAYHGSVHIWYLEDNRILLQKRSMNKESCAGKWDAAVTGHIDIGETPLDAALRELSEELSLEVCADNLKLLFIQNTHIEEGKFISNEVNYVYKLIARIDRSRFLPQKEEIDEIKFVEISQIRHEFQTTPEQFAFTVQELERVVSDRTPNHIRTNFHTHTFRCKHASGTEEDYICEAICRDIPILGFSDHGPFPHKDYGFRMAYTDLPIYINTLERLSYKYQGQIRLLKGVEIEYLDTEKDYYYDLLTKHGLDYLALGQHFFEGINGEENIYKDGKDSSIFVRYAKSIERALRTKWFSFVAHPDLMFMRDYAWDDNAEKAVDIIINAAQKYDAVLEFNANGFRRSKKLYTDGVRYPYPHPKFWEKVAQTKIRVLVGSDCHTPEQLYDTYMERAVFYADTQKLNRITAF